MSSNKVPNSVIVGVAAVGVGALVGSAVAYLSTRLVHKSRMTQEVAQLHDNIVAMKRNMAAMERELERINQLQPQSIMQAPRNGSSSVSSRKNRKKTVSFSQSTSENGTRGQSSSGESFYTGVGSSADSFCTANEISSGCESEYFSQDEDDEFFDVSSFENEDFVEPTVSDLNASYTANDVSELNILLQQTDRLFSTGNVEDIDSAHRNLLEKLISYSDNSEVLWRMAKSCRNMSNVEDKQGNAELKKKYIFDGYNYAERALQANSSSPDTHKWFAIFCGARGEYLSTKDRIASGQLFKKHIDCALSYSPNDSTLHHLLGRFCFEVADLSWLERKAAAALFGEVPSGSYEESLDHFETAERLHESGWKENRLFIVKCLVKLNQMDKVPLWIQKGMDLVVKTADDMLVNEELQKLQSKYGLPAF